MSTTTSTRDGLLWVTDISPNPDGSVRVSICEMVGERGYLRRRMSAARALARRAVNMTGATTAERLRWVDGQEHVTITVQPAEGARADRDAPELYRFTVKVWGDGLTREQAAQVVAERLSYDEDYGFNYRLDWDEAPRHLETSS